MNRTDHYEQWLKSELMTQDQEIPDAVKHLIGPKKTINNVHLRKIMKAQGLNKYYEYITMIINKNRELKGLSVPEKLSEDLIIELLLMFNKVLASWPPSPRKTFFNHSFITKKLLQVLGHRDLRPLKMCKEKIDYYEKLWADVCSDVCSQVLNE